VGSERTGLAAADIEEAARIYARAERAGIYYTMGITQHTSGTDNVKALANLALITGNLGKPGAVSIPCGARTTQAPATWFNPN